MKYTEDDLHIILLEVQKITQKYLEYPNCGLKDLNLCITTDFIDLTEHHTILYIDAYNHYSHLRICIHERLYIIYEDKFSDKKHFVLNIASINIKKNSITDFEKFILLLFLPSMIKFIEYFESSTKSVEL